MKLCTQCKFLYLADEIFCRIDGTRLTGYASGHCTHCNYIFSYFDKFCAGCGEQIPDEQKEEKLA